LHVTPRGASYTATREDFAVGRPLNVTDMAVGPDGALYFTTGGRGTQSGLYRIRYTGGKEEAALMPEEVPARAAREVRHRLETFHPRMNGAKILPELWPHLGDEDRWIRNAARIALETVPPPAWRERALAEEDTGRSLTALLALVRVGEDSDARLAIGRLDESELSTLSEMYVLEALRIYEIALARVGPGVSSVAKLDALYPAASGLVNRELCKLLVNLRAPGVVPKTTGLLAAASTQEDRVHFLFFLRHSVEPRTLEERRIFFAALREAEQGQGAQNYGATLRAIKTAVVATLTDVERTALAPLLEDKTIFLTGLAGDQPRRFVRDWSMDDLTAALERVGSGRSFAKGREAFAAAMCLACHRVGADPGGVLGPDLTAVASRFGRRDLLEAILNPSRAMDEKFRSAIFRLKDGRSLVGTIESENAETIVIRPNPLVAAISELRTSDVAAREWSAVSPMPTGLLSVLEREQILDLLAYLEAGGNPAHAAFRAAAQQ
jgi:putative heme-binding domain-containing protein